MDLKRKLAAIIVADVVGYSRLIADDEEATLRRLEVFRALWQDYAARYNGRIFNTAGDAVLAEFPSAVDAVRCSLDFQQEARHHNQSMVAKRQMHFRIGITIGDVVERGGDLLGDGVNVAARLQGLAGKGGQGGICVSSWVRETVANKLAIKFTDLGEQTVKNIPGTIRAYAVAMPEDAAEHKPGGRPPVLHDWIGRITTSYRGVAAAVAIAGIVGGAAVMVGNQLRTPRPAAPEPKTGPPAAAQPAPAAQDPQRETAGKGSGDLRDFLSKLGPSASTRQPPKPADQQQAAPTQTGHGDANTPSTPAVPRHAPLTPEQERALKPGDVFKECDACPEMVVVRSGEFTMGSPASEPGRYKDEGPTRKVAIRQMLAISRYAVRLDEFSAFVAASGHVMEPGCRAVVVDSWVESPRLSYTDPGFPQEASHPAVCLSWNDAKAYTGWLASRTGRGYRLPSEAEREYVTRAGTSTVFWWGNDIEPRQANYDWRIGLTPKSRLGEPIQGTMPVNAFDPNPWGIYQVHGNVREWVEDCWNESLSGAPSDGSAWLTGDCTMRVQKGGSWGLAPRDVRAAFRSPAPVARRAFITGIRVARTLR